jgi:hypothetical protein
MGDIRQQSCPIRGKFQKRGDAMTGIDLGYVPRANPCAQCGKPIAVPEWIEQEGPHRVVYLWHCWACDYCFEAVAVFEEPSALAA